MPERKWSLKPAALTKKLERFSKAASPLRRQQSLPSFPTHGRRIGSYEPPPPLPDHLPPRTRCLTPTPSEVAPEEHVRLHEQPQSRLLSLPDELLVMIYRLVMGNKSRHIVRRRHKLGHTSCIARSREPDACREAECRGLKNPSGLCILSGPGSGNLIQLLQSCRKVYAAAVEVLYSSNIFDFDSMESVVSLSCAVLPQRFDSIESIHMDFRFSLSCYFSESTPLNDGPRWLRTWAILGSIKSLQNLWVRITWPSLKISNALEQKILEPLWMVNRLRVYEVSLPPIFRISPAWGLNEEDWRDAPFQVTRRSS